MVWPLQPGTFRMKILPRIQRTLWCLVVAVTWPLHLTGQADGDPITLGTYRVVHSEVLGEDRVLQIHLPRGYDDSDLDYPVAYLFYSDWLEGYFSQVVNDLYHLSIDRMPPVILVGIPNVQRYRDLYPWSLETIPEAGHASDFLRAVQEEIIPFVEQEYRTAPFRIMVGPQAAAVFGAYALLEAPGTFQAFILNDPCRLDSPERSLCADLVEMAESERSPATYLAISQNLEEDRWPPRFLLALRDGLGERASTQFRWRVELTPDWPFFLAPVATREALLDLFDGYALPGASDVGSLEEITEHYQALSGRLGFAVEPPELVLVQASVGLMERRDYVESLGVLSHLVELYPSSFNGPWQLANLYRVMGDTATAIQYYEECLRRDPDMAPARQWLERLRR